MSEGEGQGTRQGAEQGFGVDPPHSTRLELFCFFSIPASGQETQ